MNLIITPWISGDVDPNENDLKHVFGLKNYGGLNYCAISVKHN